MRPDHAPQGLTSMGFLPEEGPQSCPEGFDSNLGMGLQHPSTATYTGPHGDTPQHGRHLSAEEQTIRINEPESGVAAPGTLRRVLSGEAGQIQGGGERGWTKAARCAGRKPGWQPARASHVIRAASTARYSHSRSLSNLLEPEEHRGSDTHITQDDGAQKQDLPWERPLLTRSRLGRSPGLWKARGGPALVTQPADPRPPE